MNVCDTAVWIKQEEERNRLTQEALADGAVIKHLSVQAWADSLSANSPSPLPR